MTIAIARDISLIILICPMLICLLIPLGIAFGAWWGTRKANKALRPRLQTVRFKVLDVRDVIVRTGDQAARPIYFFEGLSARWRAMWRALLRRGKETKHG